MIDIPEPKLNPDGSVEISEWVRRGKMLVRRDALDLTDPQHPVNVLEALGLRPEEYGYRDAICERYRAERERRNIMGIFP